MEYIFHSNLLQSLGWAVLNSLWQMAFLWAGYQVITALFRNSSAAFKGNMAFVMLLAGFGWFGFTFLSGIVQLPATNNYFSITETAIRPLLQEKLAIVLPLASVVYLLLLVLPVINFIRNYRYVHIIRHQGLSRPDVQWKLFVQKVSAHIGIQKNVQVWMSELVSSPVTVGYLKPVILLPVAAMNQLTIQQTEAIILHELAHIRRFDYLINLISKFIHAILYFNPFTTAFLRIIEKEREKSCDETVIQFQYEPHGYATALLTLEKTAHLRTAALALAAAEGKKSEFRQRIEWILGIHPKPTLSFSKISGVLGAIGFFILLNAFLIIKSNSRERNSLSSSMNMWASPMAFTDEYGKGSHQNKQKEENKNKAAQSQADAAQASTDTKEDYKQQGIAGNDIDNPEYPYSFVKYLQEYVPELDSKKEKQIKEALTESQRVLKEIQWQTVEKSIADAMTLVEKDILKKEFKEKYLQIDTEKIANEMRLAYDQINWNDINVQLDHALAEITLDSLKQVYTIAISNLNTLQKELETIKAPGVPDTDITVDLIDVKKKELEKAINKLKAVRPKKIVRL